MLSLLEKNNGENRTGGGGEGNRLELYTNCLGCQKEFSIRNAETTNPVLDSVRIEEDVYRSSIIIQCNGESMNSKKHTTSDTLATFLDVGEDKVRKGSNALTYPAVHLAPILFDDENFASKVCISREPSILYDEVDSF